MSYPSLQGERSFETVAEAVKVLDDVVLRLKLLADANLRARQRLQTLKPRRGDRLALARTLIDLQCEYEKTWDTLSVHGFGARPSDHSPR